MHHFYHATFHILRDGRKGTCLPIFFLSEKMTSVTRERDESKNNSRDSLDRKLGKIEELELNEL